MQNSNEAVMDSAQDLYRWLGSMREVSNALLEQELKNESCDPRIKQLARQRLEESLRDTATTIAKSIRIRNVSPGDLNGLGRESFDQGLAWQKENLEKDARAVMEELIDKRKQMPDEITLLLKDMIAKQSSLADTIQFESEGDSSPEDDMPALQQEEFRDLVRMLVELEETLPETIKDYDTLSTLLNPASKH